MLTRYCPTYFFFGLAIGFFVVLTLHASDYDGEHQLGLTNGRYMFCKNYSESETPPQAYGFQFEISFGFCTTKNFLLNFSNPDTGVSWPLHVSHNNSYKFNDIAFSYVSETPLMLSMKEDYQEIYMVMLSQGDIEEVLTKNGSDKVWNGTWEGPLTCLNLTYRALTDCKPLFGFDSILMAEFSESRNFVWDPKLNDPNKTANTTEQTNAWYKTTWVWLIIVIGVVIIILAIVAAAFLLYCRYLKLQDSENESEDFEIGDKSTMIAKEKTNKKIDDNKAFLMALRQSSSDSQTKQVFPTAPYQVKENFFQNGEPTKSITAISPLKNYEATDERLVSSPISTKSLTVAPAHTEAHAKSNIKHQTKSTLLASSDNQPQPIQSAFMGQQNEKFHKVSKYAIEPK